jgi:hypothetical protein
LCSGEARLVVGVGASDCRSITRIRRCTHLRLTAVPCSERAGAMLRLP